MTVHDICDALDALAPPALAYEWDRSGLAIGNPATEVTRVLIALTVTRRAFQAARRARAQMIVSHHPPIWEPLRALRTDDPGIRLCTDIAAAGMAAYAAHTNLDLAPGGVNDVLAERLGLAAPEPLLPAPHVNWLKLVAFVPESHAGAMRQAVCDAGAGQLGEYTHCTFSASGTGTFLPGSKAHPYAGRKGRLSEVPELRFETLVPEHLIEPVLSALKSVHPYEEPAYDIIALKNLHHAVGLGVRGTLDVSMKLDDFARRVRRALAVSHVRVAGALRKRIKSVAVIGGAGAKEAARLSSDVDVLVTGDVGYHDVLAAQQRDLAIIDAGHAGTEKWIVPHLAACLRKKLGAIKISTYAEPETFQVVQD